MLGRSDKHATGRGVGTRVAALKHVIRMLPARPGRAAAAFPIYLAADRSTDVHSSSMDRPTHQMKNHCSIRWLPAVAAGNGLPRSHQMQRTSEAAKAKGKERVLGEDGSITEGVPAFPN